MITQDEINNFGRVSILAMLRQYGVIITTPLPLPVLRKILHLTQEHIAQEEQEKV